MAEVYEARLEGSGGFAKRLALKLLLPDCQREPELVKSFIDEARIAAGLSHPNVVQVFDFGQADETYYMAMELVDGWDLREVLRRAARRGRRLTVPAAAYIVHEVAQALHYIHTREGGIVHRDVSPHNVFVTREGHVKLGDFGVAKSAGRLARTEAGQIKGKLAYLAPEQVSGDPVTGRTDVYGAGLVLFELLTGRRFNQADRELDLLQAAQNPVLVLPSTVAPQARPLDEVVRGALQRHPAMRTRDAALLVEQLEFYLTQQPFQASDLAGLTAELFGQGEAPPRRTPAAIEPGQAEREPVPTVETVRMPGASPPAAARGRRWVWVPVGILAAAAIAAALTLPSFLSPTPNRPDAAPLAVAVPRDTAEDPAAPDTTAPADPGPRDASPRADTGRDEPDGAGVPSRARRRPRRRRPHRRRRPAVRRAPPPRPVQPVPAVDHQAQARRLADLVSRARARGLWTGDDPAFDRRCHEARAAIRLGRDAAALLQRVASHVEAFRIDQGFIQRKLRRLDRAIRRARVSEAQRRDLTGASQRILQLVMAERLVEASRRISGLLGRL
jgi:hypothetical protein